MNKYEKSQSLLLQRGNEPEFNKFINIDTARRNFCKLLGTAGAVSTLGLSTGIQAASTRSSLVGFSPIPISTHDTVEVPPGYTAKVLISWGDPLFNDAPAFAQSLSAEAQEQQFGDNTDGMSFFPISGTRGVMVVNNEYTNYEYLFAHKGKAMTADDVRKAQAAHGVSIFEIVKTNAGWKLDKSGKLNRRITANTPMQFSGPVAGNPLLKTAQSIDGRDVLGTFNNCANGQTPWGTYLTCEENFHGYFGSTSKDVSLDKRNKRYGISTKGGWQWHTHDSRFDISKTPNEPNRFGWVVEIDPFDPNSVAKKRTALGRFKHENAAVTINKDGRVVVYLGDDERGEHLYKFVSDKKFDPNNLQNNKDILDEGTLYVAIFDGIQGQNKGQGRWVALTWGENGITPKTGFANQAEVLIFAREAATVVGATTMDRPEWVAVHPDNNSVFCTLTNNKYRGVKQNQPINAANPRKENPYGHIIRWRPDNSDHAAERFSWDLAIIAGNPVKNPKTALAGSDNITEENMFNSPDGIGFDRDGRMWILTDGKYSNKGLFAGMGNNQMLCYDVTTNEIRRFLTGPIACEITGLAFTADSRTMFVGIQHPGEGEQPSHFPGGGTTIPRSSIMVISKNDGGVIGT